MTSAAWLWPVWFVLMLAACHAPGPEARRPAEAEGFPPAGHHRPLPEPAQDIAPEELRDREGEAQSVMDLAGVRPGVTVADIGAGQGYLTVRLARRVGKAGRVLAEDISEGELAGLGDRVQRERLDNVSIRHGLPADPRLPARSFDRVFMLHMYHEISEPYAFLWHLQPALRPGGKLVIVERDQPSEHHGTPPRQLFCEMTASGYRLTQFLRKPGVTGYYAEFETAGKRPDPMQIRPCSDSETGA